MTDLRKQPRGPRLRGPRMIGGEKRDCEVKVMITYSMREEVRQVEKEDGKSAAYIGFEAMALWLRLRQLGAVPVGNIENVRQLSLGVQSAVLNAIDSLSREAAALGVIADAAGREIVVAELDAEAEAERRAA